MEENDKKNNHRGTEARRKSISMQKAKMLYFKVSPCLCASVVKFFLIRTLKNQELQPDRNPFGPEIFLGFPDAVLPKMKNGRREDRIGLPEFQTFIEMFQVPGPP